MKYKTKDAAIRLRHLTVAELIEEGAWHPREDEGEFHVRVSPVANGWWTRTELTALHRRISALLAEPVPVQQFDVHGEEGYHAYDAAYRRGYLPDLIHNHTLEEGDAAVAAMAANVAHARKRDRFLVIVDGRPWMDGDGRFAWPLTEAEDLAAYLHGRDFESIAVVPAPENENSPWQPAQAD